MTSKYSQLNIHMHTPIMDCDDDEIVTIGDNGGRGQSSAYSSSQISPASLYSGLFNVNQQVNAG